MAEREARLALLQFLSGSVAACGAVTVTNPFDMLKTRRQLYNELGSAGNVPRTISIYGVWRAEGVRGMQRGLVPAYMYQVLMNGTRFAVYERVRHRLARRLGLAHNALLCNALAGATAGGSGALIGSPFNLIKSRFQSCSPHFATGYQHGYASVAAAIRSIWGREGLGGFYRGASASVLRTTVGSAVQLSSYDALKPLVARALAQPADHFGVHFCAAMGSGVLACLTMNPFDVVMTRLYNQKARGALYAGLADCAAKTIRAEGVLALWKGLLPHFARIGPHTVLLLVLLEQVRAHLGPLLLPAAATTTATAPP